MTKGKILISNKEDHNSPEIINNSQTPYVYLNEKGDYVISPDYVDDLLDILVKTEEIQPESFLPRKRTYCCHMGYKDNPNIERQQFKARFIIEASLYCVRMSNNKKYDSVSCNRGECEERGDEQGNSAYEYVLDT